LPQEIAALIWDGPPGDDGMQRAMENPLNQDQYMALKNAFNQGMVPKEQMPRVYQQLAATDTLDMAMQEAESGEPLEQAYGRVAQRRISGDFNEYEMSKAFETKVDEEAARGNTDPQELKKHPGFIGMLTDWWKKAPIDEKIAAVIGVAGAAIALVNTLMGGSGTTSLITGALGLGGLAYALGGGKWLKKQFGWGGEEAAPDVTPAGQQRAMAETANAQPGAPPAAAGAPPGAAAPGAAPGNPQDVIQSITADKKTEPWEIAVNKDTLQGMSDADLVPLLQTASPRFLETLEMAAANPRLAEMFGPAALEEINAEIAKKAPGAPPLTMQDFDRMMKVYSIMKS